MNNSESTTIVLSKVDGIGEITMCGCGVVSLHLGDVSLRLHGSTLLRVDQLIREALGNMHALAVQGVKSSNAHQSIN